MSARVVIIDCNLSKQEGTSIITMKKTLFLLIALNCALTAAASASLETEYTLGDVMYVGDSITHGHQGPASYRWAMHKILVDNGISYDEVGYNTGNNGGGVSPGTKYGGITFENVHSSQSSARAWEISGRKDGSRFGDSNIYNWLDLSDKLNNGGTYTGPTFTGEDAPETFFLMIGTNDTLSDFSGAGIGGNNGQNLQQALTNLMGYNSTTKEFAKTGDMDKILTAMRQANPSADITVSSIPCWMDGRSNNDKAQDFAAIVEYNQVLKQWSEENNVRFVEVNRGMYDVANTAKPGIGVASMFTNDKLHPGAQGDLIIAGNIAKNMGLAGRTGGQSRVASADFEQTITAADTATAILTNITTTEGLLDFSAEGASSVAISWENAGAKNGGFTVELVNWVVGNGAEGGWDTTNALTVTMGNGSLYGTLSIDEAYIKWGNTILFSEDMSAIGSAENLRIAYLAGSAGEGVSSGFYVWLDDMLIGEALYSTKGAQHNGVTLTYGGTGVVTLGSLSLESSASYAPTTTRTSNSENAFLAEIVPARPAAAAQGTVTLPSEYDISETIDSTAFKDGDAVTSAISDTATQTSDQISITAGIGTSTANAFGNKTSRDGDFYITFSSGKSSGFSAAHGTALYQNVPTNVVLDGNILLQLTDAFAGANSMFGIANAGSVTGDVTLVFDSSAAVFDNISGNAPASVSGAYQGSIGGTFKAVINSGTFQSHIHGGVHTGNTNSIGQTRIYINGGNISGNVYGGGRTGIIGSLMARSSEPATQVVITHGIVEKDVYGGGSGGIINGDTKVLLTGGTVKGSVYGGGSGDTINGNSSVTIDGNLAAVHGNTISGGGSGGTISGNSTVNIINASASDYDGTIDKFTGTISGGTRSVVQGTRTLAFNNSILQGTAFDTATIENFDAITLSNSAITLTSLGGASELSLQNSMLNITGDADSLESLSMDIDSKLMIDSISGTDDKDFYITLTGTDIDLDRLSISLTGVDYADGSVLNNVYILSEGVTYNAEIAWLDQQSPIRNLVVGAAVPEPTSATLSLLALAALAARRRRS